MGGNAARVSKKKKPLKTIDMHLTVEFTCEIERQRFFGLIQEAVRVLSQTIHYKLCEGLRYPAFLVLYLTASRLVCVKVNERKWRRREKHLPNVMRAERQSATASRR